MNLYILNRNEEVVSVISNEGENAYLTSAVLKEEINKLNTFDIELSTLAPEVKDLKEENFVLFKDICKKWRSFIIKEVDEVHGAESKKTAYCEDSSQELIDYVYEGELQGQVSSPRALITNLLVGTRWEAGNIDEISDLIAFPESVKNCTVLEAIGKVRDTWNLQVDYRIEVAGNKIIGRYVDLKKNIGSNTGKRFEYSKDIVSVERTIKTTDLKTAVIPYGAEPQEENGDSSQPELKDNIQKGSGEGEEKPKKPPIDIRNIKWEKPTNPLNKPLGQNYLEIPEATQQWGYKDSKGNMKPRFIYYENTEMQTPEELINDAYKMLKKISKPDVNYKLDVIDLFALTGDDELSFETVNLGDIVTVIDNEFTPAIRLRTSIISKEVDLLVPENSKVELGSFIRNLVDSGGASGDTQLQTTVNNLINNNTGLNNLEESVVNVSNKIDSVSDDLSAFKKAYDDSQINFNWIRNSGFNNGAKYWNFMSSNGSISLVDSSQIAYFEKMVRLEGVPAIEQSILGFSKLFNNAVTLSAFIYGAGKLSIGIKYKDGSNIDQIKWFDSEPITLDSGWKRYSVSCVLKQTSEMKSVTDVVARFTNSNTASTCITGLQLNLGTVASKYIPNSKDKLGAGFYDQIKDVNNELFRSGQGYIYLEESDGIYVYDKPSNNRPMKMTALKGGMLGIGNWNMQTQQWDINTFIDGNMVNASCINTGKLQADLIKVGTLQSIDGSVSVNMESGGFQLGGRNGDSVFINNGQVKTKHKDGSYTIQGAEGFVYVNGTSRNQYHHLLQAGEYTCSSEQTVRLNVPAEFKGKDFKVVSSIKRVNVFYDVYKAQAPLMSFYAGVSKVNTQEGWFEIYASVRAWDKDNIGEGDIIGDHPTDKDMIKPTVAYWIFL